MSKIIFWGTPQFSVPVLQALIDAGHIKAIITQSSKPQGRGKKLFVSSPVKQCAVKHGLPVLEPDNLNAQMFLENLKKYLPALFFVVAYGKLIPQSVLDLSEKQAVNLHPSLLPKYRGPSPMQAVLLNGETMTGLTLMQLDEQMDHGPILAQKKVRINDDDNYETLSVKLSMHAPQFVLRELNQYMHGELIPHPQDHKLATLCKLIKTSDAELNFDHPAQEILNKIRALNPRPGTYFIWNGKRIKILSAKIVPRQKPEDLRFHQGDSKSLVINCAKGALEVISIQPEGKSPMHSIDFLRGNASILHS